MRKYRYYYSKFTLESEDLSNGMISVKKIPIGEEKFTEIEDARKIPVFSMEDAQQYFYNHYPSFIITRIEKIK